MKSKKQKYINAIKLDNQMKEESNLRKLAPFLQKTHVKLNLDFLNKLLQNASKSDKPHRNQEFAEYIGCPVNKNKKSAMSVYGWMTGYRTVPFSKLIRIMDSSDYKWRNVEENLISIKAGIKGGEISPRFPIKMDMELGSIVGHILGDGSIEKKYLQPFYTNSNISLIKEFINNMEHVFGIEPRIWLQKSGNFKSKTKWVKRIYSLRDISKNYQIGLFYPRICGILLHNILGKFACGNKKEITEQIKKSNKNLKLGLIKAFFDDESCVDHKSQMLRVFQDNKQLLDDLKDLLSEIGIDSNPIRSYVKRDKPRHYFNITKRKNFLKYYDLINFTSKVNKERLAFLVFRR